MQWDEEKEEMRDQKLYINYEMRAEV